MQIISKKCFDSQGNEIEGLLNIMPEVFFDERGFFQESWNMKFFNKTLEDNNQSPQSFVQDNHSRSIKGTLRGLHFQKLPSAQGKLIRCTIGEILDVAVDLRISSKTFLKYYLINLSSNNHFQFWIPKGFAHGFLTLSDYAEVHYKTTEYWDKDCEVNIRWNDPKIGINWPHDIIDNYFNISKKDSDAFLVSQLSNKDFFK